MVYFLFTTTNIGNLRQTCSPNKGLSYEMVGFRYKIFSCLRIYCRY